MRMPSTGSSRTIEARGVGGTKINLREVSGTEIIVPYTDEDSKRKSVKFKCAKFYLAQQPKSSPPLSLLGLDFLKEHNLRLIVDMSKHEAYLERKE